VLPGADLERARHVAERVRLRVQQINFRNGAPATFSMGVATIDSEYDFNRMLGEATQRLLQAKARRKRRISYIGT
jgi:PleD family two-component response regulator